jgi:sterol desaturase/sphingolipid hydroxylase (fatty acid hydroxylase superfamily)
MLRLIRKIWHYDFRHLPDGHVSLASHVVVVILLCLLFGAFDLVVDTGAGLFGDVTGWLDKGKAPFHTGVSPVTFKWIAYGVLGFVFVYITAIALLSYRASFKQYNKKRFAGIFWAHLLSNLVSMGFTFLFFAVLGGIAYALGYTYHDGVNAIQDGLRWFGDVVKIHIPTLVAIPYPFALLAGALIGALPAYFAHWLCHQSRLLWYVSHRCHHTAEIMHPAGIGPFTLLPEIFEAVPTILITAAASKLFTYEPMLKEAAVLAVFGIMTEKFSHTSAFYHFAYRTKLLRYVSAYYGNGVYHYMHHTSKQGDEIVNVGGPPFMLWDRVFGTYRIPTPEPPKVGLTNNPVIALNPFKIIFSGIEQIIYELRMNKDWSTRLWIVCGTVYYRPPISKDFLILGYPDEEPVIDVPLEVPVLQSTSFLNT